MTGGLLLLVYGLSCAADVGWGSSSTLGVFAAASTVLVTRAGLPAFHAAFWVICVVAALGALTAATTFPRRVTPAPYPDLARSDVPLTGVDEARS